MRTPTDHSLRRPADIRGALQGSTWTPPCPDQQKSAQRHRHSWQERLLYGTDCGAATDEVIDANTEGLAGAGLSPAELADIEHGNAAALFA